MATVTYIGPVEQTEWYGVKFTRNQPVTTDNASLIQAAQANPNYTVTGAAPVQSGQQSTLPSVTPVRIVAEDGMNAKVLRAGAGSLVSYSLSNSAPSSRYVRFYDTATQPDPASSPVWIGPIMVTAGSTTSISLVDGLTFTRGLGIAITAADGDHDDTPVLADDVVGFVGLR